MQELLEINNIKNLDIDKKVDLNLSRNTKEFQNIVHNVVDRGADYVIKAMPVNDSIKDVLIDVKNAFKTKDFKEIVKTAVNSSIREGLEILSIPKNVISDITKIKDIALKGGLSNALSAGIDIISKRYLKGNIFEPYITKFLDKTKEFVFSNAFKNKIDMGINRFVERTDRYKSLCDSWYKAYEKFDLKDINYIAKTLSEKQREVIADKDCVKQNKIIQNMTELVNTKKDKLSQIQLQICNNL